MSARTDLQDAAQQEVTISMTPMIDVVFLLLIFFMVSMQFNKLDCLIAASLPTDRGTVPTPARVEPEPLRLRLRLVESSPARLARPAGGDPMAAPGGDARWRIRFEVGARSIVELEQRSRRVGGRRVTTFAWSAGGEALRDHRRLNRHLDQLKERLGDVKAIIAPDRGATYQAMMTALGALTEAKFSSVSFAAQR